jgi:hypothetical protein
VISRSALRVLRSLPRPVLLGAILTGLVVILNAQVSSLLAVREPALVALTGLTGFMVATGCRLANWKLELLAGMIGALLVAGFYLALIIWLQLPLGHTLALSLLRATIVGGIGAGLARLLRQRAVL